MTIIRALFCRCRDGDGDGDHRCRNSLPCLLDPAQRSTMYLKVALVMLHLIFIGVLFLFYGNQTTIHPWYVGMYLLLFVATIAQYFFTAGSSPGYVLDTMRTINETNALARTSLVSKQPATSKNGNIVITVDHREAGRNLLGSNELSWTKLVMDLYPPGAPCRAWTCPYCNVLQPPRAKHCHDCDKCVLQFDHHCVWLGTCIGQGNHCRFWWYICEETTLCLWTCILYITYLQANILKSCYLIMTNQTTFELVRRRRIAYLRGIPGRVYPFSKGICKNLYNFCFSRSTLYGMERLPTAQELEEKSRPYTCLNILSCRCC
ncbi:protein S-acyltransferase 10 isoform X2 [Daucus carota subsp. sativus]|uniref:protein S-acyltransferase 10 isoform X2 n=1 Tax=Daucus carota subsp. sativus TaxID=79200 RepID=UPI003082B2C9